MRVAFFCVLVLVIEGIAGRPNSHNIHNDLNEMTGELLKPLADESPLVNSALHNVWKDYEEKMNQLSLDLSNRGIKLLKANTDTCQDVKASMNRTHDIANKGADLLVEIVAKLSDTITTIQNCITINPFAAVSCSAHKLEEAKAIYALYQKEINEIKGQLSASLKQLFSELYSCITRINS